MILHEVFRITFQLVAQEYSLTCLFEPYITIKSFKFSVRSAMIMEE